MFSLILVVLLAPTGPEIDQVRMEATLLFYSVAYQIPPDILYRLAYHESRHNPKAVSYNKNGTYDSGILQLNSKYLDDFKWRYNAGVAFDPLDIHDNLRVGCLHLKTLYKQTRTWEGTIISWNCGLSRYRTGKYPTASVKLAKSVVKL